MFSSGYGSSIMHIVSNFRLSILSASNTLFWTLFLALILLLGVINVGPTFWKWNPYKVVGHTLISPNKRVNAKESDQKIVLLA